MLHQGDDENDRLAKRSRVGVPKGAGSVLQLVWLDLFVPRVDSDQEAEQRRVAALGACLPPSVRSASGETFTQTRDFGVRFLQKAKEAGYAVSTAQWESRAVVMPDPSVGAAAETKDLGMVWSMAYVLGLYAFHSATNEVLAGESSRDGVIDALRVFTFVGEVQEQLSAMANEFQNVQSESPFFWLGETAEPFLLLTFVYAHRMATWFVDRVTRATTDTEVDRIIREIRSNPIGYPSDVTVPSESPVDTLTYSAHVLPLLKALVVVKPDVRLSPAAADTRPRAPV